MLCSIIYAAILARWNHVARENYPKNLVFIFAYHARRGVDESGFSVSGGFDMNGDGLSDFIIGAPDGGTVGEQNGEAYVVFGKVWEYPRFTFERCKV